MELGIFRIRSANAILWFVMIRWAHIAPTPAKVLGPSQDTFKSGLYGPDELYILSCEKGPRPKADAFFTPRNVECWNRGF